VTPAVRQRRTAADRQAQVQTIVAAITQLLDERESAGTDPASLTALDLGAGNGIVGEELRAIGVSSIVGVDLLPEASAAAKRDRPTVYDDYLVADLTALTAPERERLARSRGHSVA